MSFQIQLHSRLQNNIEHLPELTQNKIRPLLQLAVKSLEHDNIPEGALDKLSDKYNIEQSLIDQWYSAILTIVRLHLRYSIQDINQAEMKSILQQLKFSSDCADDIITVLYGPKRVSIIKKFTNRLKYHPEIISIQWSVPILPSSKPENYIPRIIMSWTLHNNRGVTFSMTIPKFHELRKLVAKLLLEIINLEKTNYLKNAQH